jgi:hexulose-6-phosphate isomerase
MHGRLLPPEAGRFQAFPLSRWREEFALAERAGIDGIEWIYEVYGEDDNPLGSDAGIEEIGELAVAHGVDVESVCADWFMDRPLLRENPGERMDKLEWLLGRCSRAGIKRVVVPFVDASRLEGADDIDALVELLRSRGDALSEIGVEMHLETDLGPDDFAELLGRVDHELVLANYDSGNSASLGYDAAEEFGAYGDRIGSVHIKDRVRGGGTVPLGEGDADVPGVIGMLREGDWDRPLVLQVARGDEGHEADWLAGVAREVRTIWERSGP